MRNNIISLFLIIFSAVLTVISFPKWNIESLAWIAFVPMLFALEDRTPFSCFMYATFWSALYHIGLLYWLTHVMKTYTVLPFLVSALILLLLCIYLGMYAGITFYLMRYLQIHKNYNILFTLPILWVSMEYAKSHLLTGFPWENVGYSQYKAIALIQIADITGIYGLSFIVVLVNTTIYIFLKNVLEKRKIPYTELILCISVLLAIVFYGRWRWIKIHKIERDHCLFVSLVQANIKQELKWDPKYLNDTLRIYKTLTFKVPPQAELIIWPEAAIPFYLQFNDPRYLFIKEIIRKANRYILLGAPYMEGQDKNIKFFNSAFLFSPDSRPLGRYDKIHLVPYGEYVPLRRFFPFINKIVEGIGDFSPGKYPTVLKFPKGNFGVLICYEIIFPSLVRRFVNNGAQFLVNITNDAWFGKTSAPYQHLSMATIRAVETRRWILRCANTGISAFIDPLGRIVQKSGLFTEEILNGKIHLLKIDTFYSRFGDIFAWICIGVSLLFLVETKIFKRG